MIVDGRRCGWKKNRRRRANKQGCVAPTVTTLPYGQTTSLNHLCHLFDGSCACRPVQVRLLHVAWMLLVGALDPHRDLGSPHPSATLDREGQHTFDASVVYLWHSVTFSSGWKIVTSGRRTDRRSIRPSQASCVANSVAVRLEL